MKLHQLYFQIMPTLTSSISFLHEYLQKGKILVFFLFVCWWQHFEAYFKCYERQLMLERSPSSYWVGYFIFHCSKDLNLTFSESIFKEFFKLSGECWLAELSRRSAWLDMRGCRWLMLLRTSFALAVFSGE